ncbi:MAG TPA: hypothetical protein PK267_03870, partial [Atribacterota bacterium]|nr:hypothetical protein [Atribacterota bacterium]
MKTKVRQVIKKYCKISVLFFFVLFSFFVLSSYIIASSQDVNIEQQKEQLNKIEQRKKEIQKEVERLKQEKVDYQKSLQKIQELLATAEKELQNAKNTYENTLKEITKLEEQLEIEQNILDLQLIIFKNRVKKYYKYNNISYLSVLIDSKDFSQFLNRCRYLEKVLENDADIIKQVNEQVELVKKQRDSLYNKREITRMLEKEIVNEKENIAMSVDAKNKYLTKIEEDRKKQLAVLEELERSSAQIKEIIEIAYREKEKAQQAQQVPQQSQRAEPAKKEPTLQPKKGIFQLPLKGTVIS